VNNNIIESIDVKWIYINIKLTDSYLFSTLDQTEELWEKFWESDINKWESIVVDYSSPNTAKHLHAWHIRSTILWHVLSNLYNSTWYFTHRTNHINDWGWFWYLIEWYESWKNKLPKFDLENDMLFHIYTIYRLWEKAKSSKEEFSKLEDRKIIELKKYYGDFIDYESFAELFNEFLEKSKIRFSNLEKWNKQEVELWSNMVEWSMKDFNRFYDVLDIKQDYFVWESFYANMWKNLVKWLEEDNKVVFYDKEIAEIDINKLDEKYKSGDIEEKVYISLKDEILADIWCYVVQLPNFERFVVLKSDKSTIYATRDLAAIKYRAETFKPSRIIYEVWQEQEEHFDKLFKSWKQIGIDNIDFSHIYHWFYIDAQTKKKLSSRDWASNVQMLISESIEYFRKKYDENDRWFSKDEIDKISHELAIWSIIFNDIKKDKKNPVLISNNIDETCKSFESSWWAYIVYSICRANSIISKYNKQIPNVSNFKDVNLEDIEKTLILEINRYPLIIQQASSSDNPAVLTEYLSNLARNYNSYYNSCPVLEWNNEYRIVITSLVSKTLTNGMKICHIKVPERI
jgi:arginyl-tRNA synthetase